MINLECSESEHDHLVCCHQRRSHHRGFRKNRSAVFLLTANSPLKCSPRQPSDLAVDPLTCLEFLLLHFVRHFRFEQENLLVADVEKRHVLHSDRSQSFEREPSFLNGFKPSCVFGSLIVLNLSRGKGGQPLVSIEQGTLLFDDSNIAFSVHVPERYYHN